MSRGVSNEWSRVERHGVSFGYVDSMHVNKREQDKIMRSYIRRRVPNGQHNTTFSSRRVIASVYFKNLSLGLTSKSPFAHKPRRGMCSRLFEVFIDVSSADQYLLPFLHAGILTPTCHPLPSTLPMDPF